MHEKFSWKRPPGIKPAKPQQEQGVGLGVEEVEDD